MELGGNVIGSIAGSLHLEGEGDSIEVNPIITSGTKIAEIIVNRGKPNEAIYDLYVPVSFSGAYDDLTGKPRLNGHVISGNMFTNYYSADEQIVGLGENNKPLYQKTIESGSLPPDSVTTTGLTNIETCHVIAIETISISDNVEFSPSSISTYNYQGAGTNYGYIYLKNNELQYDNGSRVNTIKIRAVIQYTKTTD